MNQIEQNEELLRPLQPAVKKVWRIKLGLFWLGLTAGAVTYDVFSLFRDADGTIPAGAVSIFVVIVGIIVILIHPRLRYKYWRFNLGTDELYLERGILNRMRTIVPLRRIQHIDVSQDVLEREFDIGKLIVHTAGSRSSEVILPGLRYGEAEELRDKLKHYILEDAV